MLIVSPMTEQRAGGLDGAGHLGGVRRDPEFTVSDDTLVVAQTFRLAGD
jgi:hypothetical protein